MKRNTKNLPEYREYLKGKYYGMLCDYEKGWDYEKLLEYERYKNKLRLQPITDKEYEQKLKAKAEELGI